jgi:iron complex outermembrane recepter protein
VNTASPSPRRPARRRTAIALGALAAFAAARAADDNDSPPRASSAIIVITGGQPSSLPTYLPTTVESITAAEIDAKINASDSEDALKYFPSLLVRKRYIGDYNHAVLSSRASGTGNSARSMVYADGILLSNYLGNGASFTPRWGLVTPEEIQRVDVLYGPFSAAYAGNSVGAVVEYVTRLPTRFEAHAKVSASAQPFSLYGTDETYTGWQASASLGSREGALAWWFNLNHLDSQGQPQTFATRLAGAGTAPTPTDPSTPVSGAVAGNDKANQPWFVLGAATQYRTVQDHAKLKLAVDLPGDARVVYTLGTWRNASTGRSESYLRQGDGSTFYSGSAQIDGRNFNVTANDFNQSREALAHVMQGLSLRSAAGGAFEGSVSASLYDYRRDLQRTPTAAKPAADDGGVGRLTNLAGTGWNTLAAKGLWRVPGNVHRIEVGAQQERYRWRQRIDNADDWIDGEATTPISTFAGETTLRSVYAQDAWTIDARWMAVLGLRYERWTATDGRKRLGTQAPVAFAERREQWLSPKAALGFDVSPDWSLKLSSGRAVRAPTVGELFQGNAGDDPITNPNLLPERSWTSELSSVWTLAGTRRLRATLFHEDTRDALYSQATAGTTPIVNSVQNIDRIRTTGFESAFDAPDVLVRGLDVQASVTFADSRIVANSGYVSVPGDTINKQQPRVPRWRASVLASWRATPQLTATLGARYGGRQYGTLNNSDSNGFAYQGFSKFFTVDARLRWQIDKQWSAALGIDNLNNYQYWNFHPYPQRTYSAELGFDL